MLEQQTDQSFEDFWNAYSDTEIKAYTHLLKTPEQPMEGIFREWVSLFETRPELLMGFLEDSGFTSQSIFSGRCDGRLPYKIRCGFRKTLLQYDEGRGGASIFLAGMGQYFHGRRKASDIP